MGQNAIPKLELSLSKIRDIAKYVNENKRRAEDQSKLLDLQERLSGDDQLTLVLPMRRLVREGELLKLSSFNFKRTRRFFLFNDMLLWATTNCKIRGYVDLAPAQVYAPGMLADTFVQEMGKRDSVSGFSQAFAVEPAHAASLQGGFEIIHPKHSAIAIFCSNETERRSWVGDIVRCIRVAASKESDMYVTPGIIIIVSLTLFLLLFLFLLFSLSLNLFFPLLL